MVRERLRRGTNARNTEETIPPVTNGEEDVDHLQTLLQEIGRAHV